MDTFLFNRCFLSAGSPASSPAKSRVVEVLCILLYQRHSISKREVKAGKVVCTTRWRLVISDYKSIRARLLNTTALDGVNLVLFTINETTLVKWYMNDVRRDEIRMLMQGLPPSQPQLCADDDLLPAKELPSSPAPPPVKPHSFPEAEDTSGQATVRRKAKSSSRPPAGSGPSAPVHSPAMGIGIPNPPEATVKKQPGSSRDGAIHDHRSAQEGSCHPTSFEVCPRLYIPGELPPYTLQGLSQDPLQML